MASFNSKTFICPYCGAENQYCGNSGTCIYCGNRIGVFNIKSHTKSNPIVIGKGGSAANYIYQSYDKWEDKTVISQRNSIRVLEQTYIKFSREINSNGKDILFLCIQINSKDYQKRYCHLDTSTLYIDVGENVYTIEGATNSNIDYDKKEEWGDFEINKNILNEICKSDNTWIRIKTVSEQNLKFNFSNKNKLKENAVIFYHLVYDKRSESDIKNM